MEKSSQTKKMFIAPIQLFVLFIWMHARMKHFLSLL